EYLATIYVRSKIRLIQLFKDRLNEDRRTVFKTTCFGPWLDIIYVKNDDDGMIHYVLQKQCCSDDDNFGLPLIYDVNGHSLHFGRRGLYGEYLNKRSAACAAKKQSSEDSHPSECVREAFLIDRVRDLESICETLLTLPKEQEILKKVVSQSEDYLQSTSEDEPDIKDHTSPKEDDGNVYSCDDNEDVLLFSCPPNLDVMGHCKFPWCNDITVDCSFWNGLSALDDNRKGRLLDEHIVLWATYLWLTRQTAMDWAMVISYFLPLLFQGSMILFYTNNDIYPVPWSNVERIRDCFEEKILVVLKETCVFEKKNIDPTKYKISFKVADGVPKQGGVFGDCGVFLCMFLYRLANGIPLALDDPLQSALAYHEKLIHFYFKHKMFCP
nr:phospholipase-like protein [Tanacetum cinerariifolium]